VASVVFAPRSSALTLPSRSLAPSRLVSPSRSLSQPELLAKPRLIDAAPWILA
jgi:hypothetical protein